MHQIDTTIPDYLRPQRTYRQLKRSQTLYRLAVALFLVAGFLAVAYMDGQAIINGNL